MQLYLLPLGTIREIGEPIEGYLIHRDDGTNVLVDTGCPRDMVGDETAPFAVGQDDHIVRRLASVGLEPANIHLVICTHLERWGGLALRAIEWDRRHDRARARTAPAQPAPAGVPVDDPEPDQGSFS